jgi:FMN reductase
MTINILAIGGSTRPGSSSEQALRVAGRGAEGAGAKVTYITGRDLMFPIYDTETPDRSDNAKKFLEAVAAADGLIISTPGYHGGMSGMIKNALDYIEDLREGPRVYLDGMAVGCICCCIRLAGNCNNSVANSRSCSRPSCLANSPWRHNQCLSYEVFCRWNHR